MDSADGKIRTLMNKEVQAVNKTNAANSIITMFEGGKSAGDIITTNKDGPWTGTSSAKLDLYVEQAASYVLAMQQTVPGFDTEKFIKDYLEIKAPNNGPDLLKNASTGDKIRKLRADLTSEGNSVNTKMKKEYKEMTSLLSTQGVTPSVYNTHVEGGVTAGVYSKTKAKDLKLKYDEKVTKKLLTLSIKALNEEEQAFVAKLKTDSTYGTKTGQLYVPKDTKKILENYEANLNKQVKAGDMSHEKATENMESMQALVLKTQNHLTYLGDFDMFGKDNASQYASLPPETKAWVKAQVHQKLLDNKDMASVVKISTSNPVASKAYVSTLFPHTNDLEALQKGLERYESLEKFENGYDVILNLPTRQKNLYDVLAAIKDLDGIETLSEEETRRAQVMLKDVGSRDFSPIVRLKYQQKTDLNDILVGLPNDLQAEMLSIYDYLTQEYSPADVIANLKANFREKYIKVVDRPGSVWTGDITAINFGKAELGAITIEDVLAAFITLGKDVPGPVNIKYSSKANKFIIGRSELSEEGISSSDLQSATMAEIKTAFKINNP